MDSYTERLQSVQSDSEALKQYLGALPVEGWSQQSACDFWQVQDVVAHLVNVADFYAGTVLRGVQGDSSAPLGGAPAGSSNAASSAESIAQRSIDKRVGLGNQLLATFSERDNHLDKVLNELSSQDMDKPCYHPGGIVPARNFVDMRFKELALHDWDIRSSFDDDVRLSPASLPSMMLLISHSLASGAVPWAFWPGPKLLSPVRYRFDITEPVPFNVDVAVDGDKVRIEDPSEAAVDVRFRCDTEAFIRLMYGRLDPASAMVGGLLDVEGNRSLVGQFNQWFKGI